jgi:hypothetical protein
VVLFAARALVEALSAQAAAAIFRIKRWPSASLRNVLLFADPSFAKALELMAGFGS